MDINIFRISFQPDWKESMEATARAALGDLDSHALVREFSQYHVECRNQLSLTNPEDKEYLRLAYILVEYLEEVSSGSCPCLIVRKITNRNPRTLNKIFNVDVIIPAPHMEETECTCLSCGDKYKTKQRPSGFGETITWERWS